MQTSEKTDEIIPAFVAAQADMGKAVKGSNNPAFRGSKYADLESVMEACRDALKSNGMAVFQTADAEGSVLSTRIYHTSGQWLESVTPLIVGKKDMQGFGSAVTYARRYALMAALGIAPEDDDGNAAAKNPPQGSSTDNAPTATPKATPDAAAKVTQWVEAQIAFLATLKSTEEYDKWRESPKVEQNMPVLQDTYPDNHKRLIAASMEAAARVAKPLAAE